MKLDQYFSLKNSQKKFDTFFPIQEEATSAKELYDKFISKSLFKKVDVIRWHKALINYLFGKNSNPIIFARLYESDNGRVIDGVKVYETRRGCITIGKDENGQEVKYVFISNHDASEFCNIVKHGVEDDLFEKMITNFDYPLHYQKNSPIPNLVNYLSFLNTKSLQQAYLNQQNNLKSIQEETYIHANFKNIGSIACSIINMSQRYLAHIIGVKDTPYLYSVNGKPTLFDATELNNIMPRGSITDWTPNPTFGYARNTNHIFSKRDIAIMKAHCLRLLDPLNYFVTPSITFSDIDGSMAKNKNIGEYYQVQQYVREKYIQEYGKDVMDEFEKYALVPNSIHCFKTVLGKGEIISFNKIQFGFDIYKKTEKTKLIVPKSAVKKQQKYSESIQIDLAMYFLTHNNTYQQLDNNVLNCQTDRHGNTSYTLLKKLGLATDDRNILSNARIDDLILSSSGKRKETLIKVKQKYNIT